MVSNCPGRKAATAASFGKPIAWKAELVGAKNVYTPDLSDKRAVKDVPARLRAAFKILRLASLFIASAIDAPEGVGGTIGSACGRSLLQAISIVAVAATKKEPLNNF